MPILYSPIKPAFVSNAAIEWFSYLLSRLMLLTWFLHSLVWLQYIKETFCLNVLFRLKTYRLEIQVPKNPSARLNALLPVFSAKVNFYFPLRTCWFSYCHFWCSAARRRTERRSHSRKNAGRIRLLRVSIATLTKLWISTGIDALILPSFP